MENARDRVRLRALGVAALVVGIVEVLLCFAGPIAFMRKPALMLFPVFSHGLGSEEVARVGGYVEREIALTNCYGIANRRLLEDRGHPLDKPIPYQQALEIAQQMGLERLALAVVLASESGVELSVTVRSVFDGETIRSTRCSAGSLGALLAGGASCGDPQGLRAALSAATPGMGLTDYLVLGLLAAHLCLALAAARGREPGILGEIVWATALVLSLFAYIYARGANMDYMQRFVAASGQIQLARSTAVEQLHALLRFGPLLLADGALVLRRALRTLRESSGEAGALARVMARWALGWVMLSAALFALSFPSFVSLEGWGFLAWVALVPLLLVLVSVPAARGCFYGIVFGALQALLINFWHGTYSYVTLHLVTIGFVVEYALFLPLLTRAARGRWGFIAVAAAWTVFDALRSTGLLAYPWGLIGTTQYRFVALIQIASLTGAWGVGFVIVLCNAAIAWAASAPARPRGRLLPLAVSGATLAASVAVGAVILHGTDAALARAPATATIVLVQPNTDPRKHAYEENLARLRALTDERLASLRVAPDLVVWPEGAFPFDIRSWSTPENAGQGWGPAVREFLDYQSSRGIWLLTGTADYPAGTDAHFNSSTLIDSGGRVGRYYHKMRLVPFTEHFPLDKQRFAGLYAMFQKLDISDWSPGDERVVFEHDKMRLVTMICFEDVFADHVRRFVQRDVDVILNIGNDYWSLSPVEGRQHGILALFRAVENHRPVLRATSSGYTVSIDAAGRIRPGAPDPYTAASMVTTVSLPQKRLTLYTRWGDWFPALCGLTLFAAGAARFAAALRRRRAERGWRGEHRPIASKLNLPQSIPLSGRFFSRQCDRWRRAPLDAMMDAAFVGSLARPGGDYGSHLS